MLKIKFEYRDEMSRGEWRAQDVSSVQSKNAKEFMVWELTVTIELFQLKNYKYLQNCKDVV